MEIDCFDNAIYSLKKPQEKRKLLQILIVIRKGIDDNDPSKKLCKFKTLNESGTIKNLIGCLQLESNSILDITLSILGNCCVDPNFARNSMKLNILHFLNRVLDKHNKDSIIGRAFRIIGNLCENVCSGLILIKEPSLIDKIVSLLTKASRNEAEMDEKISEATIIMALRTIRKLLKKSTLEKLIITHKVLKAVGLVLIKYTSEEEPNSNEIIINDILKLLHIYSKYVHPNIIQSLKNTDNGDSLLCLGKLVTTYPTRVIKIITNLNKYCALKSDLPVQIIWQKLIEKISTDMDQNTYIEYLKNMHRLIDNPSNREYMQLGDSISQLINILKEFTVCTDFSMECCTYILSMLSKCQYNDALVLKQVNLDIVSILIGKLEWTGISSTHLLSTHMGKKRKRCYQMKKNKRSRLFESLSNDSCVAFASLFYNEDRCTSPSDMSEVSSDGPNSPNYATIAEDVSDSDNYSPVCSDAEDTDINSLPSVSLDPDCASPSDDDDIPHSTEKIQNVLLQEINNLLWRYCRINPVVMDLANPKLLTLLMNMAILNDITSPSTYDLLAQILRKSDYLIPLMQTNFIPMLYDVTLTEHDRRICCSCNRIHELGTKTLSILTKVAESGAGKGNIAHYLLRSNTETKDKIVIAIPYIIRSKHIITKLLIQCGALNILLNLLENKSDAQERSIKGLCVLAIHHLKIKNPVHIKIQDQKQLWDIDADDYCISETCTNVVVFKLDDGSTVLADRDFLSGKSVYFNSLLNGSFKESDQSEVSLQNISNKSLKLLLILLHHETHSFRFTNIDLDTILDLLEVTERYLFEDLTGYLMGCVEQFHMTCKTVPSLYQWSIESRTNILRVETIAFALVADILDTDRMEMFHDLFSLGYYSQLRDDIQKLIQQFLR